MHDPIGHEKTLEANVIAAIDDLYADGEGRNIYESIAQFQRVRDYADDCLDTLKTPVSINDLQCDTGLQVGN